MKIVFFDCKIFLNGCLIDEYFLEDGERIDFLCLTNGKEPFDSFVYRSENVVYSDDFDVINDDTVFLFVRKRNEGVKILEQKTFTSGYSRILATAFFDEKNYLSVESDESGYNLFQLDKSLSNVEIFVNYFGDVMFVSYDVSSNRIIRAYSLPQPKEIFYLKADEIRVNDSYVDAVVRKNDVFSRVIRRSYSVAKERYEITSESIECANVDVRTRALVGVLFFESVVAGDKERMASYLAEDLLSDFSEIFELMKDVDDFLVDSSKNDLFFVTRKGRKEIYKLSYENGKINDILSN